jgi:hypothetical protein
MQLPSNYSECSPITEQFRAFAQFQISVHFEHFDTRERWKTREFCIRGTTDGFGMSGYSVCSAQLGTQNPSHDTLEWPRIQAHPHQRCFRLFDTHNTFRTRKTREILEQPDRLCVPLIHDYLAVAKHPVYWKHTEHTDYGKHRKHREHSKERKLLAIRVFRIFRTIQSTETDAAVTEWC